MKSTSIKLLVGYLLPLVLILNPAATLPSGAQELSSGLTPRADAEQRVWTVEEILAERLPPQKGKVQYCNGGRFQPCVCTRYVSRSVQYRPAVEECGGDAAIVLSGKYLGIFSVVVRDSENRDRWPTSGYGGCSSYERDVLGLNKCSAFKVQDRFSVENADGDADVYCLGASGYSKLFKNVRRITAKLKDVPGSNKDPLARWCLKGPKAALN